MENRLPVQYFIDTGPLPSEEEDDIDDVDRADVLLEAIVGPVSDEEAQNLARCFGEDNCFGLAWTLLHLIETAPRALTANYPNPTQNIWVKLLNDRVQYDADNPEGIRGSGSSK